MLAIEIRWMSYGLSLKYALWLSLIHISEPTRLGMISYAVFCLNVVFHSVFSTSIVLAIEIRWTSYGLSLKYALWCTHLLGSLKRLVFRRENLL